MNGNIPVRSNTESMAITVQSAHQQIGKKSVLISEHTVRYKETISQDDETIDKLTS